VVVTKGEQTNADDVEKARETFRVFFGRGHCDGWPYALVCFVPDHILDRASPFSRASLHWNEAKRQHSAWSTTMIRSDVVPCSLFGQYGTIARVRYLVTAAASGLARTHVSDHQHRPPKNARIGELFYRRAAATSFK
jgi:hypothetical protein